MKKNKFYKNVKSNFEDNDQLTIPHRAQYLTPKSTEKNTIINAQPTHKRNEK